MAGMSNNTDDNEKRPVTDERRSLYERAAAAADAGEIAAPERRPTLRAEETYVTDENIIEQAISGQREAWEVIEQQAAEIERLRAERDRWQDIAAGLAETSRHGGYCPSYDGFGCDAECGVGDALAAYEDEINMSFESDENIIEQAAHGQGEAWAELDDLGNEVERLRALITAWADADIAWADASEPWEPDTGKKFTDAVMALRKEARRD